MNVRISVSFITYGCIPYHMKFSTEYEMTVHRKRALEVVNNLKDRQINGYYYDNVKEGLQKIGEMIPAGSTVGLGGSATVIESGLIDALRELPIDLLDRYKDGLSREDITKMRFDSLTSDVFIASTNAITLSGQLINVDGIGNRVASMIFGPKKVILLVGVNKIVDSIEEGIERVHSYTAPINVQRFGAKALCGESGLCDEGNCMPPGRICNKYTIIEGEYDPDRFHVVLVGERLGF